MSDDEQIAQLKDWWQRNGKPLVVGGVLALVVVFGWQAWQKHQVTQAEQASALYQQLMVTVLSQTEPEMSEVVRLANALKDGYSGTEYAQYGQLFVAKVAVEDNRLDDASNELRAVVDKPASNVLGELARQRLARVLAAQDKAEEALVLLDATVAPSFLASREELRGDILRQLGRNAEAYTAYDKARLALPPEAAVGTLQLKLDDLTQGDA